MRILGLDLATATGWAISDGRKISSGVVRFPVKRGESPGMRFLRFRKWLKGMCVHSGDEGTQSAVFDLICYEEPHLRGAGPTAVLVGLVAHVQEIAAAYGIEHTHVHSGTLKKWATGHGKASKEDMKRRASDLALRDIEDDNEADAILIAMYAEENYG